MGRGLEFPVMRQEAAAASTARCGVPWCGLKRNSSGCVHKVDSSEVKNITRETSKEVIVITQV